MGKRILILAVPVLGAIGALAAPEGGLPLKAVADIPIAGRATRLDYQSLDPVTRLLFIAHLGDGVVHAFDVEKRRFAGVVKDVAKAHGVLAVPELSRVFASATGTDEVVAIDAKTLAIAWRAPGGDYPDGMGYDPGTRKLFVSDEHGGTETVIDAATGKRVATIDLGGEAGNTQYDPVKKRILVNVQTTGELVAIDPKTDAVARRAKLEGADGNHGLYVDAERGRAYVACEGSATLLEVDLETLAVEASHPVGKVPDVLAFDPGLRRLYVSSESGVVSVFEAGDRGLAKIGEGLLAPHAHTVAVDPATHLVYFPLEDVDGKPVLRIMEPAGR